MSTPCAHRFTLAVAVFAVLIAGMLASGCRPDAAGVAADLTERTCACEDTTCADKVAAELAAPAAPELAPGDQAAVDAEHQKARRCLCVVAIDHVVEVLSKTLAAEDIEELRSGESRENAIKECAADKLETIRCVLRGNSAAEIMKCGV